MWVRSSYFNRSSNLLIDDLNTDLDDLVPNLDHLN